MLTEVRNIHIIDYSVLFFHNHFHSRNHLSNVQTLTRLSMYSILTWASLNKQSLQSECLPVQPHFPGRLGWSVLWTLWSAGSWWDPLTRNHPPGTQYQQAWLYDILKNKRLSFIILFYHGFINTIVLIRWLIFHIEEVRHNSGGLDTYTPQKAELVWQQDELQNYKS